MSRVGTCICIVVLGWGIADSARADSTCFAPFLTDTPPKIVETLAREVTDGVEVTRLKFLSRVIPESGQKVIIYAVMARPTAPGPHPGVLVCHGGGGYADMVAPAVVGWAKRGFVSVCQDQPGICNRSRARSTPCLEAGASIFRIIDGPSDSSLFDGVAAALNGLALLRSQPDVDKSRIGVFGGSWGGYMTTMVTGLAGDRVRAAFSVYGCGYFDVGSAWTSTLNGLDARQRKIWLDHLDAGRHARNITAAYFVPSPSNDWFFWPSAVMRTLADIPGEKNYCFMPNDSHSLRQPGGMSGPPPVDHRVNRTYMEIAWLEYHLMGKGKPFPRATVHGDPQRLDDTIRVAFDVKGPEPIRKTTVWYAAGELPWRMKWWAPVPAHSVSDNSRRYAARVPVQEPNQPINWFAVVTDRRNVSVSTLIQTLQPASLDFKTEGYPKGTFRQDFEDAVEYRRWRKRYGQRSAGRYKICAEAARSGKFGLHIHGPATIACWGLRGATLRRAAVKSIRIWARSASQPCVLPMVEFQAECADGQRVQWRWKSTHPKPIGPEWQAIDIRLTDLQYQGNGPAPFDPLSPALGQLRLISSEATNVYIDDIEARSE